MAAELPSPAPSGIAAEGEGGGAELPQRRRRGETGLGRVLACRWHQRALGATGEVLSGRRCHDLWPIVILNVGLSSRP